MTGKKKTYSLSLAGEERTIAVPADNVRTEFGMTDFPPLADLRGAVIRALEQPIGCAPLADRVKPGDKVAIMTGDRITDKMLGTRDGVGFTLLDYFNRLGVPDDDITLVYAGGLHANRMVKENLGPALMQRVKTIVHDPKDDATLYYCGVTPTRGTPVWINKAIAEADFTLGVGEVSPTVHGGWTGGGKIILPGVAGRYTIEHNHHWVLVPKNTYALADGNHMRVDMEEAADLAGLKMKLDIVVNSRAEVVEVFAGDFRKEHRKALEKSRQVWLTKMEGPTDIAVIYPGELRETALSRSLWISLEASEFGTQENGIIIMVLSASDGWASAARAADDLATPADVMRMSQEEVARLLVRKDGNVRNVSMVYSAKKVLASRRVFLVSQGISPDEAKAFGFAMGTDSFDEALGAALSELGPDATISMNLMRGIGWRTGPWREG